MEDSKTSGAPPARSKRGGKRAALVSSIKRDVAQGHVVTLIAFSASAMEEYAKDFTAAELRMIRFSVPGMCLTGSLKTRRRRL